ncbi:helix-hairpin-helix domain-containing protein [Haloparvum sedimenti]|uniref:helix-hairpin-helix domain-containing protein n=1 Tax=Haloparvum sedimenti TaxID=1678448 RepID=UPI00071E88DC|nr:helix-hairpin-helix domain-containing protein [Haloparvum sedimenti]
MASDELDATTDVVTLAEHVDGLGAAGARRLEDAGIETVSDILIADEGALMDVPYVSATRAATIREVAEQVAGDPDPREVDFEATESVVRESALPLAVRRGEAVLTGRPRRSGTYHTTDCRVVTQVGADLEERSWEYVDDHDLCECEHCAGEWSNYSEEASEPEPLAESPGEVVLEATLGERLQITFANGTSWATDHYVCEVEEPVEWETPLGENWQTRRIGIESGAGQEMTKDLVATGDGVWLYGDRGGRPYRRLEEVETVAVVGRVSSAKYLKLKGRQERANAEAQKPEGDDSWQKYTLEAQEGETA